MTKDEIIKLAREAGLVPLNVECDPTYTPVIERFAELVRKEYSFTHAQMWLKRFDDAIKAEREACAKVCDSMRPTKQEFDQRFYTACTLNANAIRARGNT